MENNAIIDNTTGTVAALENGNQEYIAKISTLLGPKYSLPKGGVIRPGIMVLKPGCTKDDEKMYSDMACSGLSWDDIEKKLGDDSKGKSKLRPANVDYFTVNPGDCMNPANAKIIKEKYADADGKIRRLPVWFPVNEWWNILPHSLRCWGQSGIRFMSDITTGGRTVCRYPLDATAGKRMFGGRQWGNRPCVPEECKEYQAGECKFGGTIQFYIPGVKGAGIWVLPTTSWYSMVAIKSVLQNVSSITNGRLARLFNDTGESVFVLTKTEEVVASVDWKTGKPVQRTQYLIYLDVNIDMTELALMHERKNVAVRAVAAVEKLNGNTVAVTPAESAAEPEPPKELPEIQQADPATEKAAEKKAVKKEAEPEKTSKEDDNTAKKKALIKGCVELRKKLPKEKYNEIRAKYPEQSSEWTLDETSKIYAELLAAVESLKDEAAKAETETPAEAVKKEDGGSVSSELIEKIIKAAEEYGVPGEFGRKVTNEQATSPEIAQNWIARLEQGDFSMFLVAAAE